MESSSISQESLDTDDIVHNEMMVKRLPKFSKPRTVANKIELSIPAPDDNEDKPLASSPGDSRVKDKGRGVRSYHMLKTKSAKDKRRLREKRRATGIVHLPSESTGDSLDDELDEPEDEQVPSSTQFTSSRKNDFATLQKTDETVTSGTDDTSCPTTPVETRLQRVFIATHKHKSTSDLDADFEDNQDYDSTVSISETNLSQPSPPSESRNSRGDSPLKPLSRPAVTQRYHFRGLDTPSEESQNSTRKPRFRAAENPFIPKKPNYTQASPYRIATLEKLVEQLQMDNKDLQVQLRDKDKQITDLRFKVRDQEEQIKDLHKEIKLLDQELDELDDANITLAAENKALHSALRNL